MPKYIVESIQTIKYIRKVTVEAEDYASAVEAANTTHGPLNEIRPESFEGFWNNVRQIGCDSVTVYPEDDPESFAKISFPTKEERRIQKLETDLAAANEQIQRARRTA
jgi:hypothetical protein